MPPVNSDLLKGSVPEDRRCADALRVLAMDAVQAANSGHPGAPMGMADFAQVLWRDFLRHNPGNPGWADRDRFVLSNGHASMLLYGLLHLTGYELAEADLRAFRQLHSRTPGHPEHGLTPGVETTTGPLGQGLANAVGFALAERRLADEFNRPGHEVVNHRTWCVVGDGCLMEGISHEACALAGTLGLGKLTVLYDDNGISIDGEVDGWFTDDTAQRFRAYGWNVVGPIDGHDAASVRTVLASIVGQAERPSLVILKTTIGFGSPAKAGTEACHGAPLGAAEVAATRAALGWTEGAFEVPADIRAAFDARPRGSAQEAEWLGRLAAWRSAYPELAAEFERRVHERELPTGFAAHAAGVIAAAAAKGGAVATRKASLDSIEAYVPLLPEIIGGSADLSGSNCTLWKAASAYGRSSSGNYLHYGVREFAMAAVMNGLSLHGGLIPFGGTFLVFSDYSRNAIRLAALMGLQVIHVLTHDSICVGEDGPTHQPVEHTPSLRLIPGLYVWRPCDAVETASAWADAIERRNAPTALILSRQNLPTQPRTDAAIANIRKGGYILVEPDRAPEAVIIATGSELALAVAAAARLGSEGHAVRVVSMPCVEAFRAADASYREDVLPHRLRARVAVEAAATQGWEGWVGLDGVVVGLDRYGESAPGDVAYAELGFTVERVVAAVKTSLSRLAAS